MNIKRIILASNNKNKIKEINEMLPNHFEIISLKEAGITEEIPEPYDTFHLNAAAKAEYVFNKTGKLTFAEDSGLVVPILGGAPGAFSARYAGQPSNDLNNTLKLLKELEDENERSAYYETVICLKGLDKNYFFEGRCEGSIDFEQKGANGFGYDPVFIPKGFNQTFGELDDSFKASISHRSKAVKSLIDFLGSLELEKE
ncbi:MAG TPA: RdgB/HAM1 family non-canonical purine NTP pyrophosphatase [Edaphocola sp.]|nr:RdgB/HAM1 family non-canonical purine NTP pyrophosphatase [Edaphocola sp.]